ncbi:hypothetical protein AGMMS49975_21350 [Clostridia bacterium]|nr:hypothetical protein AGMMS49975_21350 [Clostridia bacterium]
MLLFAVPVLAAVPVTGVIVKALYNREYVYGTYWIYCAFAYLGSRFLTALTISRRCA